MLTYAGVCRYYAANISVYIRCAKYTVERRPTCRRHQHHGSPNQQWGFLHSNGTSLNVFGVARCPQGVCVCVCVFVCRCVSIMTLWSITACYAFFPGGHERRECRLETRRYTKTFRSDGIIFCTANVNLRSCARGRIQADFSEFLQPNCCTNVWSLVLMMARVKLFSAIFNPLPLRTEVRRVCGRAFGRLPKNERIVQSPPGHGIMYLCDKLRTISPLHYFWLFLLATHMHNFVLQVLLLALILTTTTLLTWTHALDLER